MERRPEGDCAVSGFWLQVASLGPVGHLPRCPGTWGSLMAVLLAPVCLAPLTLAARFGLLAAVFVVGAHAAGQAERDCGEKDPGFVVVDELLGQWLALAPFGHHSLRDYLVAFAFFRALDILKPWPVRRAETALPGGFGVMADDAVAGVLAAAGLWLVRLAWPV